MDILYTFNCVNIGIFLVYTVPFHRATSKAMIVWLWLSVLMAELLTVPATTVEESISHFADLVPHEYSPTKILLPEQTIDVLPHNMECNRIVTTSKTK